MRKTDNFEIKLINSIKKYNMLKSGDRVLVALSGGKDSVALLYALKKLSSYLGIELCAYHLNHGIRGEEADSDQLFSKNLCQKLSVDFYTSTVDVPAIASQNDEGLEANARKIRYAEFERIALQFNCNKIATAHSASDNSETVIMTLLRNSNAKGIPFQRGNIIRPLIAHTTKEIIDYCERNSLEFVTDSTNKDNVYTRNYVRHNILPKIYEIAPSFDDTALSFSNIVRSNEALIDLEVDKYYQENPKPLLINSLKKISSNIAYYNILYKVISKEVLFNISYKQFDLIVDLINNGNTGQKIFLNDKLVLQKGYEALEILNETIENEGFEIKLKLGENKIPNSAFSVWLETVADYENRNKENELKNLKVHKLTKNILIKYNIINSSLIARSRKEGDSFICRGITRSIKKYMIDEKIPSYLRSQFPIVCDETGIVWVAGLGIADRCKNSDGELYSLSLDF